MEPTKVKDFFGGSVPGLFLFMNLCVFAMIAADGKDVTSGILQADKLHPLAWLLITFVFGYFLGVLLRALQCEFVDQLSAKVLSLRHGKEVTYISDCFPYFGFLEERCENDWKAPTGDFFNVVWKPRQPQQGDNRPFVNLLKGIINSVDARASAEIKQTEDICRYVSQMFYGLLLACVLSIASFGFAITGEHQSTLLACFLAGILVFYLGCILVILGQYRWMRIKEAETIFMGSFANRKDIEERLAIYENGAGDGRESDDDPRQ